LPADGAALYSSGMKRVQVSIDDDLDHELELLAAALGASKAEVIRRLVRERVRPLGPLAADPLARMAGADDFVQAPIDDVVYR
jgi:Arc/MetJ family transcription regulator